MRKGTIVGAVALLAAAGAGLAARRLSATTPPTQTNSDVSTQAPVPVVAGTVQSHDVPIYLQGVGTVIAFNNVVVRSQITGQLVKVSFRQGRTVHKGDLLAAIDPRPFQAALDQAVANRDRDQAQLVNAQANLNRYVPLANKGYATAQLVDTQKAQVGQLEAMVKSDEALIEAARTNLSYTQLTSPIDGVTGIRQIDEGNIIHPTDPNGLVDVTQIQPISLLFTLPETNFAQIQQQMQNGRLGVTAYSQDNQVQLDQGRLLLVDNQIVQTTGTIRLRATFPNAKHQLWPGELVNARLLIETRHDGLTVPATAVQQGPNGAYVWAIGKDQKVQMRPVAVAQISGDQALGAIGHAGERDRSPRNEKVGGVARKSHLAPAPRRLKSHTRRNSAVS